MPPFPQSLDALRTVSSEADLGERYRPPSIPAATKVVDRIDEVTARFIANCPLVMLSSSSKDGRCYVSPRGGPPGFVTVVDETHVAIPDLNGNNRLDSYRKIVDNPYAGLLFLVPGRNETVHIQGPAVLTDDATVLDGFTEELRRPKLALVVEVEELYGHCAKALMRANVWEPESWAAMADAPDHAEMYTAQKPGHDTQLIRSLLAEGCEVGVALDAAGAEVPPGWD